MIIMDGKKVSQERNKKLKEKIDKLIKENKRVPKLAIVLVGDDPASKIYVSNKIKTASNLGVSTDFIKFSKDADEAEIVEKIDKLNKDKNVDGIIVQLPLPKKFNEGKILDLIDHKKDVDGFSVINQGFLFQKRRGIVSATPKGIMNLIEHYNIELDGLNAVVIGRSLIVGLPVFKLLLDKNATVVSCNTHTKDLSMYTKQADLIVVAAGSKHLIKADMIKEGAIIVDVGINREDGKIYGDVDYDNVSKKSSYITPVPGGVGPMTINALFENLIEIYEQKIERK